MGLLIIEERGKLEFLEEKIFRCRKENQKQTELKHSISSTMLVRSECPYYLPSLLLAPPWPWPSFEQFRPAYQSREETVPQKVCCRKRYISLTCDYMAPHVALNKPDTVIYLLGTDGSIDYSILSLPVRYPFFHAYLAVLVYCLVSFLCWLISNAFRILPNTICCLLSRYRWYLALVTAVNPV